MTDAPSPGSITWRDLTVPDALAEKVRDFYAAVCGWEPAPHPMDGYDDYEMKAGGTTVAGVCRARGTNAAVPPQWLMYVNVPDVEDAVRRCAESGGTVVDGPRPMGSGTFACVRDPAGAHVALWCAG